MWWQKEGFCLEVKTYRLITITLSKSSTDDGSIKISSFWWYVRIVDDRPWDTGSRGGLFTCIKGSLRLTKGNVTTMLLHQKRFSICNCSFAIFMLFPTSDYILVLPTMYEPSLCTRIENATKTWESTNSPKVHWMMENPKRQFLPQCSNVQFKSNAMKMKQKGLYSTTIKCFVKYCSGLPSFSLCKCMHKMSIIEKLMTKKKQLLHNGINKPSFQPWP